MDSTVLIERPVEEVFGFVADLTNVSSMDPSVKSVQKTSEGPIQAGTTFRMRQQEPPLGKSREASVCYTAVKPTGRLTSRRWRVRALPLRGSPSSEPMGGRGCGSAVSRIREDR
jgi:Polyketide cyclase / dehydrase and lipid transport